MVSETMLNFSIALLESREVNLNMIKSEPHKKKAESHRFKKNILIDFSPVPKFGGLYSL